MSQAQATARQVSFSAFGSYDRSASRARRTPWFDASNAPAHAGSYEVRFTDGTKGSATYKVRAARWVVTGDDKGKTVAQWRGLTERGAEVMRARQEAEVVMLSQMERADRRAARQAHAAAVEKATKRATKRAAKKAH